MENGSFDDVVPIENEDIPIFRAYVRLPDGTFKSSFTTLKWNFLHLEKNISFQKTKSFWKHHVPGAQMTLVFMGKRRFFGLKTKDKWVPGCKCSRFM